MIIMDVSYVASTLREHGSAEAVDLEDESVVFHLKSEIKSLHEIQNTVQTIDNLHPDNVHLTGSRKKALFVVKIDIDEFDSIPPYLYDNWVDADDDRRRR